MKNCSLQETTFNRTITMCPISYLNLLKYEFQFANNNADWSDIMNMYKMDKMSTIRLAPKYDLNDSHLAPNNFEKIKVKLATQRNHFKCCKDLCCQPFPAR